MADITRQLRLNAVELLRQPGAVRRFDFALDPEPVGVVHPALNGEVDIHLLLEALNDGIAVTGTIGVPWAGMCRRCLMPLTGIDEVAIDELYQKTVIDPDAFIIEDGQLDLNPLVRETALLALDDERLCRPDCAGLCPTCGIDRNVESCMCNTEAPDPRWAGLESLALDPD